MEIKAEQRHNLVGKALEHIPHKHIIMRSTRYTEGLKSVACDLVQ